MGSISVSFAIEGLQDVKNAFESVTAAQKRMEKSVEAGVRNESRARERGAKTHGQLQERRFKELEKTIAREGKEISAAEKRNTRAIESEAKRRNDIINVSARMAGQTAVRQAREEVSVRARAERDKIAIINNSARMAGRIAERQVREEIAIRRRLTGAMTGAVSGSLGGVASFAGRVGGGLLALGGGFSSADAVSSSVGADKAATALSNSAYIPGENERPDKAKILARARSVEASTNISKKELIEGWQSYVAKSSDFKGGEDNLGFFARIAKASGSKFGDVAGMAGYLKSQNESMTSAEMRATVQNVIGQGKLGAVELPDLAHIAGKITSSSASFAGDQTVNQRKLLGLSQIAIKTAGSPEEAATVVNRFSADALKNRDLMPAGTFDDKGAIKDSNKLISDVFKKSGGNIGKIMDMGFHAESIKLFQALAPTYQRAEATKKGTGQAAVDAQVERFTSAGYSNADVQRDFAEVMATNGEKIDTAFTHIRDVLEQKLTPYIERFADKLPELMPKIERLIDAFGRLGEYILDNPYKGIAAIIAAKVTADVADALIGVGVRKAMESAIASSLGAVAIPVVAMAVTAQAVNLWADESAAKQKRDTGNVVGGDSEARDLLAKVRSGNATPEDEERIKSLQGKTAQQMSEIRDRQNRVATKGDDTEGGQFLHRVVKSIDPLLGTQEATDAQQLKLQALETNFKGLADNAGILNKALKELADTATKTPAPENDPARTGSMAAPVRSSR